MTSLADSADLTPEDRELHRLVRPAGWENPRPQRPYSLVVIGGGPAGLVAAAGAAGLGAEVALIERGPLGGDCLHDGCVPSKAVIAAARKVAGIRDADRFGVRVASPQVDFEAVMRRMRQVRASLGPHDSADRFRALGIDVYFGQAEFSSAMTVCVDGRELRFRRAVIATGSEPIRPPIPGLAEADYLTNESLFRLTELPRRMLVLGGGPIGCEMAQAFRRLGSAVTLVESSDVILNREDKEAAAVVANSLRRDGIDLRCETRAVRVEPGSPWRVVLRQGDQPPTSVESDAILVAVGRAPRVEGLGLERAGIAYDTHRGVIVDDRLRTTHGRVYAAGDVCSNHRFTHAADAAARLVIRNAFFPGWSRASRLILPRCTYTEPELAHVGLGLAEIEARGWQASTHTQPFAEVDRAVLDGEPEGFVRVHCRRGSDRILGATIVGAQAGEAIGEWTLAIREGIGLGRVGGVVRPYPTRSEASRKLGDGYQRSRLKPWIRLLIRRWIRGGRS